DAKRDAQRHIVFSWNRLREMSVAPLFLHEQQTGDARLRAALRHVARYLNGLDGFLLRTCREDEWVPVSLTVTRLHLPRALGLVTARDVRAQRAMLAKVRQLEAEWRRVLAAVSDCLRSAGVAGDGHRAHRDPSP